MADVVPSPILFSFQIRLSRWLLVIPVIACLTIITGCALYLYQPYELLKSWYLAINSCIYRASEWPVNFFTPTVKQTGNYYCIAGIVVAAALLLLAILNFFKRRSPSIRSYQVYQLDAIYLAFLYALGLGAWLYGYFVSVPAYDEVFSAINCAGTHPFLAASYYMLPNNHILFNVLNGFIGAFSSDLVSSGRILSGVAFAVFIPLLFNWLRDRTGSRPTAAIFCALIMLQFPVWGFSFQARGYSIYLLCAWASFIYLQRFLENGKREVLVVHAIAVVAGFWTLPSFLHWELALIIYLLFHMIRKRRIEWTAIGAQILAGASVFLVLLPVFCFSGKGAFLENRYVSGPKIPFTEFLSPFTYSFRSTIQYCFSGYLEARNWIYVALFVVPLILLPFIRKSRVAGSVAFYIILWLSLSALALQMQRFPYPRNLNAHVSFTLAALLLACYAMLDKVARGRWRKVQFALTTISCMAFAIHFIRFNRDHLHDSLYFYQAYSRYHTLHEAALKLPSNARVGLSDEGFYWEYLCEQRGLKASMCLGEKATHYIKQDIEALPAYLYGRVEKIDQADEYEIYRIDERRKQ